MTVNAVGTLPDRDRDDQAAPRSDNAAKISVGRLGRGGEIASAVLMVVGNAYMTGQTVVANGGLHFN